METKGVAQEQIMFVPPQDHPKNNKVLDTFVKKELRTIVLALLAEEPKCGRELKLEIFKHFTILLSSGTLYPLLHELEKEKLVQCYVGIKTKTYSLTDKEKVCNIIDEHIAAKNHLNKFLENRFERDT